MSRILGKAAAAAALLSLAAAPAIAAPGSAASRLWLRAHNGAENESSIAGAPIIAVVGILAIVGGAIVLITEDDDTPDSP